MSVDFGLKERWGEMVEIHDKTMFKGGEMSLSNFLKFQKLTFDACEGKLFQLFFRARI